MQNRSQKALPFEKASFQADAAFPVFHRHYAFSYSKVEKLHIHDQLEIGYCEKGEGLFIVRDKVIPFKPGDCFIISNLDPHLGFSPTGMPCTWHFLYIDVAALLQNLRPLPALWDTACYSGDHFPSRFSEAQYGTITASVKEMLAEQERREPFYRERFVGHLLAVMALLARLFRPPAPGKRPDASILQKLAPALDLIGAGYAEKLTAGRAARACCMSAGHFRRTFSNYMGKSFQAYLCDYRIAMAKNRLALPGVPITTIAYDCGFPTLSSFHRLFRKKTKMAPREFRNKNRQKP